MNVPEELKINKFTYVHIPSNAEYFQRFGEFSNLQGTGDDIADFGNVKIEQIAAAERNDRMAYVNEMQAKLRAERQTAHPEHTPHAADVLQVGTEENQ